MRLLCPCLRRLLLPVASVPILFACGVLDNAPSPTATPNANQNLGIEIAETYGALIVEARAIVEPRPPAPEAKELLRLLREEYKVRFGNYACLLETMSETGQAETAGAFDASREAFLPDDMSWLEDAASDYDFEDTGIRGYLEDIETLDDYAFLERVAESRPGEELLCG